MYQWQIKGEEETAGMLIEQFLEQQDFSQVDQAYFEALVRGVVASSEQFDQKLASFTDRPMADVDHMERVVLRLAAYELLEQPDVPYRVVLDEAIELSHRFGAGQGHTFINAVLDKAARDWRVDEVAPADER